MASQDSDTLLDRMNEDVTEKVAKGFTATEAGKPSSKLSQHTSVL